MSATQNTTVALKNRRRDIENVDRQLIQLLADRVRIGKEIGSLKRAEGLPTVDPAREAEVIRRACEMAREVGLPDEAVRAIFWQIVGLSRRAQVDEG